jgi:hypothetical protein
MARIEIRTLNSKPRVVHTDDPEEIERLENQPFDDTSGVSSVQVTED